MRILRFSTVFISLFFVFVCNLTLAQTAATKNKNPFPAKYTNAIDEALVIKTITLAPVYDNSNNIYKKSIEEHLKNLIKDDSFWAFSEFVSTKKDIRIDEFDENPQLTLQVLDYSKADGIITCFLIKGPQGLTIQLNFYTKDGGRLLLREEFQDAQLFEIIKIKDVVTKLYESLKTKLPYSGYITSRKGNKITVNIGSKMGVKPGDTLTVAQILKINRHPKLNFMTGVEKEILGRVLLTQVESNLSIGEITLEKENGVIDRGSKILPLDFVKYPSTAPLAVDGTFPNEKNPVEWLPAPTPQFGKVSILGGFSDFSDNAVLTTGTNLQSGSSLALTFDLTTELWITPEYFASLQLQQMNFKGSNGLTGSNPDKLNYTVNRTALDFGYKYLIDGNFWGPQIYASLGYMTHSVRVSDSTPTSMTSFELTGMPLTAGGLFPVTEKNDVAIGAQAKFLFFENFSENPVNSGSADSEFNEFDILGTYQYTTNINIKGSIRLTNIQATFGGGGTKTPPSRSLDEKITSYLVGIEYLF